MNRKGCTWVHPTMGKTFYRNFGKYKKHVVDFDTDYKPQMHTYIAKVYEVNHKVLKEKYRNMYDEVFKLYFFRAILFAKFNNKLLLISDTIVIQKWPELVDVVVDMPEEIFTARALNRGDKYESLGQWKQLIDTSIVNYMKSTNAHKLNANGGNFLDHFLDNTDMLWDRQHIYKLEDARQTK